MLDQELDPPFVFDTRAERFTLSAFADFTAHVTDDLDLLFGARVQRESRDFLTVGTGFGGPLFREEDLTIETVFLPKVGLAYEFLPDQTVSLVARRGFNSGGSGVDLFSGEPFVFESETVWTIEAGYRGTFDNNRYSVAATGSFNIHDDYQFASADPNVGAIENFDGTSFGLELEGQAQVTDTLAVRGGLGLVRTELDAPGTPVDGNRFGSDPEATLSGAVIWTPISGL